MDQLARLRALRFGHELYETFSYGSFFNAIGIDVNTTCIRADGSPILE